MYYYFIYGKKLYTDLCFPQLVTADKFGETEADILIFSGEVSNVIKELVGEKQCDFGEKFSWLSNKTTYFVVEDGKKITYELKEGGREDYLKTYLLGYGLAMLFLQQGKMTIHCSAVSKDGKAYLISGESGSGKSTLTAKLLEEGYSLMADDIALVSVESDGKAYAFPAFPYQKLCRDAALKSGHALEELIYIDEDKDKFLVPFKGDFSLEGKPVEAMICLALQEKDDILYTKEVVGIEKLQMCAGNLFLRKLLREKAYAIPIGPKCLELAGKIPIYRIVRPVKKDTTEEVWAYMQTIL